MSTELMAKLRAVFSLPTGALTFKSLEEHVQRTGQELLQALLGLLLESIDNALREDKPKGWLCKDRVQKTFDTIVGPVCVKRRRYVDEHQRSRYLLDEVLGVAKRQRVSPGLICQVVKQATEMSFRQAAQQRKALGLPPVSHATIHRWEMELGSRRAVEESADQEAVFGSAREVGSRPKPVDTLIVEGDGVLVHAQREPVDRFEIKISLVHTGWAPRYSGSKEWALVDRHVHAAVIEDGERYWEQACISHQKRYNVLGAARTALNGDGAEWIDRGKEYFPRCHRQLDRFHVYREIRRAYPDEEAGRFIQQLARGQIDAVLDTMEACAGVSGLPPKTRQRRLKLWRFFEGT